MRVQIAVVVCACLIVAGGVSHAAPSALICANKNARNCFQDEIFVLDGNESVVKAGQSSPIVGCKASNDCYITNVGQLYQQTGLNDAVGRALEIVRAQVPQLPEWDEIVVFTADFGPVKQPGPMFFRSQNLAGLGVNRVRNIGLTDVAEPDPGQPYLGLVDGGNVKVQGATPATSLYSGCGKAPRRLIDPPNPSVDQPAGGTCAPGVYSYFDALAQATAALYGPHLASASPTAPPLVTLPTPKGAVVTSAGLSKFPSTGLSLDVWNAFLDTGGSLLGGNSWRDDGNGTFEVTKPTPYFGVSKPYEGVQELRFQPIDLYLMGFAPSSNVPPLRSFLSATPADVYYPASVDKFSAVAGPNMGTRIGGVILRSKSGLPGTINFADIVAANGGERVPGVDQSPQHIRQLWILVTKPDFVRDLVAADAYTAAVKAAPSNMPPDMQTTTDASKAAQATEQAAEIVNLQKFRRAWNQYFYMLTGYHGRVVTTFEGNVDDTAYWEFADPADDSKVFAANGLQMEMRGVESVPDGGGSKQSVLTVIHTPGDAGTISFHSLPTLSLRVQGSAAASSAPNNLFTIRMRLPQRSDLAGMVKAKVVLSGPKGSFTFTIPAHPDGYLVPDGRFRNYSVLLSQTYAVDSSSGTEVLKAQPNTDFSGKDYDAFTLTPSNIDVSGIDIEFIKLGNAADITDVDRDCQGHYKPDGWIGPDDNCPNVYNPDQADGNGDGVGDACEDYDGDGVINACDNCPVHGNASQKDSNNNGIGDACDGADPGCDVASDPRQGGRPALLLVAAGLIALVSIRRLRRGSGQRRKASRL